MNIPQLGALEQHPQIPEWEWSKPITIPLLKNKQLRVILKGLQDSDASDVTDAISAFLSLNESDLATASEYVFNNYQRMKALIDEDDIGCQINAAEDVWPSVHPQEIYVSRRRRRDNRIYVQIMAECDWEPEHGLQIIYKEGRVLSRVSAQDGHLSHSEAYGLPEEQNKISG